MCQTFSRSQQRETLLPHEVPQGPWEKLGIDFFEFESTTYLLIADYYSRFPVIRKVRSTTANATTKTPVASQPRSYSVETANGAQLMRNRRFIRPAQETDPKPAESVKHDHSSSNERPRRVITRPKRLIETI